MLMLLQSNLYACHYFKSILLKQLQIFQYLFQIIPFFLRGNQFQREANQRSFLKLIFCRKSINFTSDLDGVSHHLLQFRKRIEFLLMFGVFPKVSANKSVLSFKILNRRFCNAQSHLFVTTKKFSEINRYSIKCT